jgi:hypothetical protein
MMYQRSHYSALNELAVLAEEPTLHLPAITKALHAVKPISRDTEPILLPASSIDERGRFYLSCTTAWDGCRPLWDDTLLHVAKLVEQYLDTMGSYPDEVCLSFRRYLESARYMARRYWPRDIHARAIPYRCESDNVGLYEILVRGAIRK